MKIYIARYDTIMKKVLSVILSFLILLPAAVGVTQLDTAAATATLHNTRDIRSHIALTPILITEVKIASRPPVMVCANPCGAMWASPPTSLFVESANHQFLRSE